jgi:hypothetical protein
VEYAATYEHQVERSLTTEWDGALQDLILDETRIIENVRNLKFYSNAATENLIRCRNEVTMEKTADNERIHCRALENLLNNLRSRIQTVCNQTIWDLERILDEDAVPPETIETLKTMPKKGKPGRKKKDDSIDNMKIDMIFKKAANINVDTV